MLLVSATFALSVTRHLQRIRSPVVDHRARGCAHDRRDDLAPGCTAQEATARTARKLFPVVDAANDQPTAALIMQRLDVYKKTARILRSLLEG
jgi:hypothetical protein